MAVEWQICGSGARAFIRANCDVCHSQFDIERPILTTNIKHGGPCQGKLERLPERFYEEFCNARDDNGKPRVKPKPEQSPNRYTVRWM